MASVKAPVCLLVLVGLPAAGKSSLVQALRDGAIAHECDVMVVSFDDFLTHELQAVGGPAAFSPELWQKSRAQALAHTAELLTTQSTRDLLVIIDDNMHLQSMRYECWRMARKDQRVDEAVITRMAEDLSGLSKACAAHAARDANSEQKRVSLGQWDGAHTLQLALRPQQETSSAELASRVWQWLRVSWAEPAPPLVSEDELREQRLRAQQATAASVLHWLDVESKRLVAGCIARITQERKQVVAKQLHEARVVLLKAARQRMQQSPSTSSNAVPHAALKDTDTHTAPQASLGGTSKAQATATADEPGAQGNSVNLHPDIYSQGSRAGPDNTANAETHGTITLSSGLALSTCEIDTNRRAVALELLDGFHELCLSLQAD